MLRIAICDDRPEQLALIRPALRAHFAPAGKRRSSPPSATPCCFWKIRRRDIVLPDICMPGISGTDVAREIHVRRDKTEIVFLTASDEYAADAFACTNQFHHREGFA